MSALYQGKCMEVVQRVLKQHPPPTMYDYLNVQQALIKAFPFHIGNVVAWKAYYKEIFRQCKMKMI